MKQLITLTALLTFTFISFSQTKEQDSLVIQLAYQKNDSAKVDTSIKLIKSFYNTNDFKRALDYIDQSERLATIINYHLATAEIKYLKALIYTDKNDYYNGLDNFQNSLNIYTQLGNELGIAKVNNRLGLLEIKRGNYVEGLRYSLSAIDIFEKNNLRNELSSAYNNLADAYLSTNQLEKALEFNEKALRVRELLQDILEIKNSTKNIANIYSLKKDYRKAIEYYEKALSYVKNGNDNDLKAEILPQLGEAHLKFREYEKATTYLLEGLRLNQQTNNTLGILRSWNNLADLNLQLNKLRLAEYQLGEADKLAVNIKDDRELMKYYGLRVKLDSTKGNFKNAFSWQRGYYNLKSKVSEYTRPPEIVERPAAESTPVVEEKQPQLVLDNSELEARDKTIKNQKYMLYGLVILLVVALSGFLYFYLRRAKDNAGVAKLERENKQLRVEKESIKEENQHLEEMNQVKDRLFSIVSHDLKDSITGVKAFLDLLKEDSISQEEFDQLIPELSENADNASALLLNLLNWSKSQMQNLEPKPESFDIQEVFREKISLVQKKVEKKRVVLLDESVKDTVYADRSMVEIVIQNLLANAVKFSRVGDVITVSNRERNGNALICIEDTGVGISKENQKKLFTQGGYTTRGTDAEKGTGLGLSICKQLVDLNNGNIWVESEPNLGSKFYVELPKE
jgi:signal transduction histidine kinase